MAEAGKTFFSKSTTSCKEGSPAFSSNFFYRYVYENKGLSRPGVVTSLECGKPVHNST